MLTQEPINWNTWALAALGIAMFTVYQLGKMWGWSLQYEYLVAGFTWIAGEIKGEWKRKHPEAGA